MPIRQYYCFDCKARFTANSLRKSKSQRRLDLNKQVMNLYCEGNTLKGISRLLECSYNTVVSKFRFMAGLAKEAHLKVLEEGEILTSYVQFDEMETFEKTKATPLGIELAIRPKTFEIIAAKVCRIPAKAMSKKVDNSNTNRKTGETNACIEIEKVLKEKASIATDGKVPQVVKTFFPDQTIKSFKNHEEKEKALWAINHVCAKLRNRLSRLNRKTWANTQKASRLQEHLDLFIACQNGYELKF